MKRNSKGFTLIELLVVITLILSLLGMAIVSFVNISNKKKEEAWESVKAEIQTAAEQYFKSNEYLYEGLDTNDNVFGKISVGKLVQEDYLNVVTDPRNGKKVSECMIVKVNKTSNNVFTTEIDENKEDKECDSDNSITVSESGAPEFTIDIYGTKGENNWFITDVKLKIKLNENNENNNIVKSVCEVSDSSCSNYDDKKMIVNQTEDIKETNFCITLTNSKGKKSMRCESIKVDKYAPVIDEIQNPIYINGGNAMNVTDDTLYNWKNSNSNDKTIALVVKSTKDKEGKNDTSGIKAWSYSYVKDSGYNTYSNSNKEVFTTTKYTANRNQLTYLKVCDDAGNCSDPASTRIKIDTELPKFTLDMRKKKSIDNVTSRSGLSTYTNNTWYNVAVLTKVVDFSDNLTPQDDLSVTFTTTGTTTNVSNKSGTYRNINAEGISTIAYKICDVAGNCASSGKQIVKLDRTKPTGTLTLSSTSPYYNSNIVNVTMTASDINDNKDVSGIATVVYIDKLESKTYNGNGSTWAGKLSQRKIFNTLTNAAQTTNASVAKMVVTDNAGNVSDDITDSYSTYALCSNKTGNITYGSWSTCSNGVKTRNKTNTYTDSITGDSCGSSSAGVETQTCAMACPTINVTGTPGNNGWYKKGAISLSHNGDSEYWTWYRDTTNLGIYGKILSRGILEGEHTYKLRGLNGENCNPITVKYDNTPPNCSIVTSIDPNGKNDWYVSNVTLSLNKNGATNYGITTSTSASYNGKTSVTQTEDTAGVTYYGYVMDAAGNVDTCKSKLIKKDTVPPTFALSTTVLTHENLDDDKITTVFKGKFNVSRTGDTYNGTICVKNIPNGGFKVLDIDYSIKDETSGIDKTKTKIDSYNFINKCGVAVKTCLRRESPCHMQWHITLADNAGNSKTYKTLDLMVGYILKNGSANYYSPCDVNKYTNLYFDVSDDNKARNIYTNVSGSTTCN